MSKSQLESESLIQIKNDSHHKDPSLKPPLSQTAWRWSSLIIMNFILLGNYYCYDNPQALQTHLIKDLNLSNTEYNLLYSIIAIPNIILPILAGYFTDQLGPRIALFLFTTAVSLGQLGFALGIYFNSFPLMVFGRAIYGLGNYTQSIAQSVIVANWFRGKELAFALGIQDTIFGICSVLNSYITPKLQQSSQNLLFPALIGVFLCVFSIIFLFILLYIDKENDQRIALIQKANEKQKKKIESEASSSQQLKQPQFKDILSFSRLFWAVACYYGMTGSTYFSFTNIANDYIYSRFKFSNVEAGNLLCVIFVMNGIMTPFFGFIVDKYGKRSLFMVIACIFGCSATIAFMLISDCYQCYTVIVPLILFGLFLSLSDAAALPCVPLVLDVQMVGTGYGLYYVIQNIILSLTPMFIGFIQQDQDSALGGYYWVSIFLVGLSIAALVQSLYLGWLNKYKYNSILQHPEMKK